MAADPTSGDRDADALGVAIDGQGNLGAVGASVAAVSVIPGSGGSSLSLLGLPASQTSGTLNGLPFAGSDLPRGMFAPVRVSSTPFDVGHGGFSGGQLAVRTFPGSVFTNGSITTRLQAPVGARGTGASSFPMGLSLARSGPAFGERLFYNTAFSVDGQAARPLTVQDVARGGVASQRIAPEVAEATLHVLDSLGVPMQPGIPRLGRTSGSAFARLDLAPTRVRAANLIGYAAWTRTNPLGLGPLTTLSHAGQAASGSFALLGEHSRLLRGRVLAHTRAGFTSRHESTGPLVPGPEGRVLVPVSLEDADAGLTAVTFGSAGGIASASGMMRLDVRHDLSWYSTNSRHRWRVTAQGSRERLAATDPGNRSGQFLYHSLDDLRAGRAARFVRDLGTRSYESMASNMALAVGDRWSANDALLLQYGVRIDADHVGGSTAVGAGSGSREAQSASIFLSPRLGFSWNHGSVSSPAAGSRPRGTLRGGIGAFRGTHAAAELRAPLIYTGLADAIRKLQCIGDATPAADWAGWAGGLDAPTACDGASGDPDLGRTPDQLSLSPGYVPPTSWRAGIGWSGDAALGMRLSADVTSSQTTGLPGTRYTDVPRTAYFSLAAEGMRPVYVPATNIDGTLGLVTFDGIHGVGVGRSGELHSGLRSRATQLSLSVSPATFSPADRLLWSAGYAYTHAESELSGFDGSTDGDPRSSEWTPSPFAARHRVTGFAAVRLQSGTFIALSAQAQSGLPFTPLVGGDINGDGLVNDRVFVTPELAKHPCLGGSVGRIARAGACSGPVHVSLDASVTLPGELLRLPARSSITVGVVNPLAAVDQVMHGHALRGWGQSGVPDPIAVHPVGFDTLRRSFTYARNPGFGDARRDMFGRWTPARLMIDVRLPLSPPRHQQLLHQVMAPGRERAGERLTTEQVKQRYMSYGIVNPLQAVAAVRDSLQLTAVQRARLDSTIVAFDARLDTIWTPIAQELSSAGVRYDRASVLASVRVAQGAAWDALEAAVGEVRSILTGHQMELMDPGIAALLDRGAIARLRRTEFRF